MLNQRKYSVTLEHTFQIVDKFRTIIGNMEYKMPSKSSTSIYSNYSTLGVYLTHVTQFMLSMIPWKSVVMSLPLFTWTSQEEDKSPSQYFNKFPVLHCTIFIFVWTVISKCKYLSNLIEFSESRDDLLPCWLRSSTPSSPFTLFSHNILPSWYHFIPLLVWSGLWEGESRRVFQLHILCWIYDRIHVLWYHCWQVTGTK